MSWTCDPRQVTAWERYMFFFTDHQSLDRKLIRNDHWVAVFEPGASRIFFHVLPSWDSLFISSLIFPVQDLILSSQAIQGLPVPLPPSTNPCIISLTSPVEWLRWPNHRNFLLFMVANRSSCVGDLFPYWLVGSMRCVRYPKYSSHASVLEHLY